MHVAILGLGPSLKEYAKTAAKTGGRAGYCDEVWGINQIGDIFPCNRVFHMDDVRIQEARAKLKPGGAMESMLRWMKTYPGTVLTSRSHPDYPCTVDYPLEDVVNDIGYGYLNNTSAYAVAYAIHLGVKKISLFGVDFSYANAHDAEKGRGSVEFMLGIAAARGIKIAIPHASSLMDACEEEKFYGYDTLHIDLSVDAGRVKLNFTPRAEDEIPTAEDMESRYDHSKHPNPLVAS